MLDPRFKEVFFTRAKRLPLSVMHAITQGNLLASSTRVVNDNEENVATLSFRKKNSLWDSFDDWLIYQLIKTKMGKNYPYTAVLSKSKERRIL